ncbi:hypothetical protein Nepgr_007374 [Nepenthes gracilis]|uniref:Uncharacterized protein n=1 Tax=Nepenthes gracilis TaxID=150966 RepID=A0AAD3XIA8_NEPGR|nr:hypothetical protein Nepgr_007374 [Nepenthes gracilis]
MSVEIPGARSHRILLLFCSISLEFIAGLSNDKPIIKNDEVDDSHASSHHQGTGVKVVIICIAVVSVVLFSLFLFKLWQKKKREEQCYFSSEFHSFGTDYEVQMNLMYHH